MTDELAGQPSLEYKLEYLFSRRSRVRREMIGPVAEGFRVNVYTESGEVRGPALNGTCGEGGDWFTLRRDGMGVVDSRVMIHAADGALIYTFYTGLVDFGEDAYAQIERGELPTPGPLHVAARFQTAAPQYAWLNRIQAIAIGRNDLEGNLWDTYAIR